MLIGNRRKRTGVSEQRLHVGGQCLMRGIEGAT